MFNFRNFVAVAAGSAFAATAALPAGAADETVLTFSSWVPPRHVVISEMIQPWADAVEKATDGRVKVKILSKAVGKPPAHFDIVRKGLADMAFGVHGYTPGRFLVTQAVEMPFLGDKSASTSQAYWRIYKKHLEKLNEHKGVKVIGLFTHGPGMLMSINEPIDEVGDLKNKKMRIGGGVVHEVAKRLEVVPMFKPAPEVYELLSRGVADGVFFPAEGINGFRLEKVVKNATSIPGGLYNTSFFVIMNEDKWNKLSKKDQEAIDKLSGEAFAKLAGEAWDRRDAHSLKDLKAAGGNVVIASPEMVAELKKRTADVEGQWVAKLKEKGLDGEQIMKDLRTEIKKLEASN